MYNVECRTLNVEYQMSKVKCQKSNVNKVKPFVGVYLRSFSGHSFISLIVDEDRLQWEKD